MLFIHVTIVDIDILIISYDIKLFTIYSNISINTLLDYERI